MPKYMLLILDPVDATEEDFAASGTGMAEMGRFAGELAQKGKLKDGAPLGPAAKAKVVRKRKGKLRVTDGPFTETKEIVSGYFIVEAKDRREAVSIASRCPHLAIGGIEVRDIIEV